ATPRSGSPYQTLTVEDIARLQVETIILYGDDLGTLAKTPLPAIQQGRVIKVNQSRLIPSVGLIDLVGEIREASKAFEQIAGEER
ncbi:MAG: hypothetical protein AAGB34_05370, partial [Planctomycetota bacterium]